MKAMRQARHQLEGEPSRAEIARRARINPATYGQIESGRLVPYSGQLDRISAALQWQGDPSELLEEVFEGDHA